MSLLLKTNIESQAAEKIRGHIARVGAAVNEINYDKNCQVTDINMSDGGFGSIKRWPDLKSIKNIWLTAKRYIHQKIKHIKYGDKICQDWKTIILDMHSAYQRIDLKHKFDASISSNVLEHSYNPIFLLLNFYFITKKNGYQYHAIPHAKYIYDMYRQPTRLEHFIEDFANKIGADDKTHNDDYIQQSIIKHGGAKRFHENYPVAYPVIHFHVFDENNTRELFNLMFEEVTNDILITKIFSENVVIFKNSLNKNFINKYEKIIAEYSKNF